MRTWVAVAASSPGAIGIKKFESWITTEHKPQDVPTGAYLPHIRGVAELDRVQNSTLAALAEAVAKVGRAELRRELASAAIRLADKHDVSELVHALMKHKDDAKDPLIPMLTWIAYEKVLTSRDRRRAAPTFAPDGLYLAAVEYAPGWKLPAFEPKLHYSAEQVRV